MNRDRFKREGLTLLLWMLLFAAPCYVSSCSPGKNANQHRMEKENARKDKEARKKYEQAIRRHEKNQSATTRSMMKEAKKETPKNTPLRKSKGKKCK